MAMRSPSFGPKAALTYVTIGALMSLWTSVWYFAFRNGEVPLTSTAKFWVSGLFLTGLMLVLIGLLLGPLGRNARKAEQMPPPDPVDVNIRPTPPLQVADPQGGVATVAPAEPVVTTTAHPARR
jgi:hypothetical protein